MQPDLANSPSSDVQGLARWLLSRPDPLAWQSEDVSTVQAMALAAWFRLDDQPGLLLPGESFLCARAYAWLCDEPWPAALSEHRSVAVALKFAAEEALDRTQRLTTARLLERLVEVRDGRLPSDEVARWVEEWDFYPDRVDVPSAISLRSLARLLGEDVDVSERDRVIGLIESLPKE